MRVASALAIAIGGASLVLAAGATARTTAKPTLTIGSMSLAASLNPAKANRVDLLAYEFLITLKPNGSYGPGLAASWRYLPAPPGSGAKNKNFELDLRHTARFSDGTPVTAAAVKTWLNYYVQSNGPLALLLGPIASIETKGRWTVIIHLKSPNPVVPLALSWGSMGAVASPRCVADPAKLDTNTCGAGPYMLDPSQSVAGDHYTFVPNPYYYDKSKVRWGKVVEKVIPTASSMLQAFETGQIMVAEGDPSTGAAAARVGATVVRIRNNEIVWGLDVGGVLSKPLADARVRQALNYAVDRKAIAKALFGEFARPSSVFQSVDGAASSFTNAYPYSPQKAKALLAAAGYPSGFSITATIPGFQGTTGTPLAEAVAKYLAAIGVTLNINSYSTPGPWANAVLGGSEPVEQEGIPTAWPLWILYTTQIKPGSFFNRAGGGPGWNDRRLVVDWIRGARATNASKYWKDLTARLTQQAYTLPLVSFDGLFYLSKHVSAPPITGAGNFDPTTWSPK
jgi:peptide/nickel transport system substrate-binding protein